MAYHSVLSTSNDFVNAMTSARQISKMITNFLNKNSNSETNYEVFPYRYFFYIIIGIKGFGALKMLNSQKQKYLISH